MLHHHTLCLVVVAMLSTSSEAQRIIGANTRISSGGEVKALVVHEGKLIIGGVFTAFNEHERSNLQGWNGTDHFDLPGAFDGLGEVVNATAVVQGSLIVAGTEPDLGNIGLWNGTGWQSLGAGLPAPISAVVEHLGTLHAACNGSVYAWNGSAWSALGGMLGSATPVSVMCLTVHQGHLYAGGWMDGHLKKWNGSTWSTVGNGLNGPVEALRSSPDGLWIGGSFTADADGTTPLPYCALYTDGQLYAPALSFPMAPVTGFVQASNDRFLIGSSGYRSCVLTPEGSRRILMQRINTSAVFNGDTYIGGAGHAIEGDDLALGMLADGDDHVILDANDIHATYGNQAAPMAPLDRPWQLRTEAPAGSAVSPLSFWLPVFIGTCEDTTYFHAGENLFGRAASAGPNANNYDLPFFEAYQQMWRIDRDMIEAHIADHSLPGYIMPPAIASWPGNGNTANGEPPLLAPFIDLDNDGLYEPEQGEYPAIRGDMAVYSIEHDLDGSGWFQPGAGLDGHIMHYAFRNSWDQALHRAVFTNVKLINRSDRSFENARFGVLHGKGAGCDNEITGCDTTLSLAYCYGGSGTDSTAGCMQASYGTAQPATGFVWLSDPMTAHINVVRSTPQLPFEEVLRNALQGLSAQGTPIQDPNGNTTTFQYNGNPTTAGTWVDALLPAQPDRLPVSSIGPFTLAPGDTLCADLAFVFAQDDGLDRLQVVDRLREQAEALRAWYQQNNVRCNGSYGLATSLNENASRHPFRAVPNPATNEVLITRAHAEPESSVHLLDAHGRIVRVQGMSSSAFLRFPLEGIPAGAYIVRLLSPTGTEQQRLIVSH